MWCVLFRLLEDIVLKEGEVEGKAKTNGMSWWQLQDRDVRRLGKVAHRVLDRFLPLAL
jgi:hypothetical protein